MVPSKTVELEVVSDRNEQAESCRTTADMSLLDVCTECGGKCCVGPTLVTNEERQRIIALTGISRFEHWDDDFFYLHKGPCPYLKEGLCSVQEVKPFVCRIFPFVPRVVDGEYWLYCVGECEGAAKLSPPFIRKARALAQRFFADRDPAKYALYWNENKIDDFDDSRMIVKIRVFEDDSHQEERS